MEGKKISFGFKKIKKAEAPITKSEEEKKEFIECMEEKSIKVIGGEPVTENKPLVIPMKPNTLVTAEKLQKIAEQVESALQEPEIKQEPEENNVKLSENETLDQMAVRELLQDAKKVVKVETTTLSIQTPAKFVQTGEKESTLDDYEAVPIQQFGMAMLRGMGWTPDKDGSKYKQPELRPKGLGLGADKVVKDKQKKQSTKDNKEEDLQIVKNSFVKITNGKFRGYYGKVLSLDEDNGRVMVEIPVKKETVSLSEFMMHAVSKTEYDKESKVINADSFDEYKKNERIPQKSSNRDDKGSSSQKNDIKNDRDRSIDDSRRHRDYENSSNGRSRMKERDRSSSEDRSSRRKKKDKKRYSSSESLSSLSDHDRKKKKNKSSRRRSSSSDSRDKSPPQKSKRDIDKKRKGKKKKRDRDRSPNYKKHRK